MWESMFIQLVSIWFIACAFGCYFVIQDSSL
jgi:hypothetical protein